MSNREVQLKNTFLCFNMEYSHVAPSLTFVLTTFNQESLIEKVIESIINYSNMPSELIVIDDRSEDRTLSTIINLVRDKNWENGAVSRVSIYSNKISRFETYCDDFGIRLAKTDYVVLVQSDVILTEEKFDTKLITALKHFPDIMMISARGTEPIQPVANFFQNSNGSVIGLGLLTLFMTRKNIPKSVHWLISYICVLSYLIETKIAVLKSMRKSNSSIHKDKELCIDVERPLLADFIQTSKAGYLSAYDITNKSGFNTTGSVWLGQTVMRGPIALDRSKYLNVGGFDLESCFLGFDDHEITLRAYQKFRFRVGFLPIGYQSSMEWGATRRKRSLKQSRIAILNCLRIANKRKLTNLYTISDSSAIPLPMPEIREFPL
jgi:glycosyltransferase involved in cell wall biosynthesis